MQGMTETTDIAARRAPRARLFGPHVRTGSVCDLTADRLVEMNVDAVLVDVDCTLKAYRDDDVSIEVAAWLVALRDAGIKVCIVSNGHGCRIEKLAKVLELPHVAMALKPLPFGLRRAMKLIGADPRRTAMVGDQLFADVLAGRLAGLRTVMVTAISPEQEPWPTQLKRLPERWLMRWLEPK